MGLPGAPLFDNSMALMTAVWLAQAVVPAV
jgi:hypothetical protein